MRKFCPFFRMCPPPEVSRGVLMKLFVPRPQEIVPQGKGGITILAVRVKGTEGCRPCFFARHLQAKQGRGVLMEVVLP